LAAIAAGFFSLSAASAEEEVVGSTTGEAKRAGLASTETRPVAEPAAAKAEPASATAGAPSAAPPQGRAAMAAATNAPSKSHGRKQSVSPTLVVKINLSSQTMTLHHGGAQRETWKISSGRAGYPTPRGVFRPQWASKMWYSRKYDNSPMPHAVFFVGGVAIHGTYATRMLGQPASHGCIRLAPGNAAHFYALVHKHGYARTRIEVFGTPPATRIVTRRAPAWAQEAANRRAISRARTASGGSGLFGWTAPKPTPRFQQRQNGLIFLPPNSPYSGRETIVYNGIVYRRVR
jgi:lipoprotein-anchoring transpeptidase ErfK/SrfK